MVATEAQTAAPTDHASRGDIGVIVRPGGEVAFGNRVHGFALVVCNRWRVAPWNVFKLSATKGKFVIVHFLLKTECPYCLRHTQAYARKAAGEARVVQIFLKPDTAGEIKQWAARLGEEAPKLPIYRDPEAALAKAYGIPDGYKFHGQTVHFPALLILDRSGKEVFRYVGKSNADRFPLEKYSTKLESLIGP